MARTYGTLARVLLVAAMALGSAHSLRAENAGEGGEGGDSNKPKAEGKSERPRRGRGRQGFNLWTTDTINQKLGDDKLTDEQKTKVDAAREEIGKKFTELREKPEFQAAVKELREAGQDKEKRAAARKKLEEASGGFNQAEEYKKALEGILTKEQFAKLYPPKEEGAKSRKTESGEKSGEAHEEEKSEKGEQEEKGEGGGE